MGRSLALACVARLGLDESEAGDDFDEGVHVGGDRGISAAGTDDLEEVDGFAAFGDGSEEQGLHLGERSPRGVVELDAAGVDDVVAESDQPFTVFGGIR